MEACNGVSKNRGIAGGVISEHGGSRNENNAWRKARHQRVMTKKYVARIFKQYGIKQRQKSSIGGMAAVPSLYYERQQQHRHKRGGAGDSEMAAKSVAA